MMSIFDEIDKHPVASVAAIFCVLFMASLLYELFTAPEIDEDDRYF